MNQEFKSVIESIKYKFGLTQGRIAKELGITQQYLSDVINDRAPYNDVLKAKIAAKFPTLESNNKVEEAIMDYMRSKTYTVFDLARILGVPANEVTETLADGFDERTARRWSKKLGFDMKFLQTGEGDLFKSQYKTIPLLPVSAHAGHLNNFSHSVSEYECDRIVSPIKDAELAIPIQGESMYPELPSGAIVFIKRINERAFIEWGKPYVLDTSNGVVVKYLSPGSEGNFKCISANPNPMYAPFEIPKDEVYGVYRIVSMLCNK